jgi:uncharacterized sulfatase
MFDVHPLNSKHRTSNIEHRMFNEGKKMKLLTAALILIVCASLQAQTTRPNILFIMADDLGPYVGCYDQPVKTPNIDSLAARGMRFERNYCQYPLCGPSRCSLMSGLRPNTIGVLANGLPVRHKINDVVTLPQCFRQHGYFSARVGKIYHLNIPGDVGKPGPDDPPSWDYTFNPRGNEFPSDDDGEKVDPNPKDGQSFRYNMLKGDGADQADYQSATEAIRLLNEHKHGQPFFLAVGFIRPHVPEVAPKTYFDLYPLNEIKPFPGSTQDQSTLPRGAIQHSHPDLGMTPEQCLESIRAYHATTSFMDAQVGRVLDELSRLRLSAQTIVVFLGDHGYLLGQHREWQKMTLFDNTCKVPLIISVPGMKPGVTAALSESINLYPTICALAGFTGPKELQGVSLIPVLNDPKASVQSAAFTQVQRPARKVEGRSVRTDRWRYTQWKGEGDGTELYDELNDPAELTNLERDPAHADIVAKMREIIVEPAATR